MSKYMNEITNILGIGVIISAAYSVFVVDVITWNDAIFGGFFGGFLIYVKNNRAGIIIEKYFDKKK